MEFELLADSIPKLADGVLVTLELLGLSLLVGGLMALPIALARVSPNPLLHVPAYGYIFFFRATPLLVQIYLIYYGSGQFRGFLEDIGLWWVFREAYWCAIIALSLNTAGYTAEILRGGIQGVPRGQIEAGRALGMSNFLIYRLIIIPGAYRLALPAYGNEAIFLLKGTSLTSVIALFDIMGWTRTIFARTFALEIYVYAALIYLALTWLIGRVVRHVEGRLNPHQRAQSD